MLLPHPESDLCLNVLVLGSGIIKELQRKRDYTLVEDIMKGFLNKSEKHSPDLFFDVLTFLFTIGILEYRGYKVRLKKHDITEPALF
jgi:hypothetical protein